MSSFIPLLLPLLDQYSSPHNWACVRHSRQAVPGESPQDLFCRGRGRWVSMAFPAQKRLLGAVKEVSVMAPVSWSLCTAMGRREKPSRDCLMGFHGLPHSLERPKRLIKEISAKVPLSWCLRTTVGALQGRRATTGGGLKSTAFYLCLLLPSLMIGRHW